MKFMFGLQHPLTCKPSTTLPNPCNKVREVNIFLKKSSCVFLHASFLHVSFFTIIESLWYGKWVYNICPIWCMCQQSSSRIQYEPGYRKRQFLSITTRHQQKGLRKMLELKEVKKKKNKLATKKRKEKGTDHNEKNRKKTERKKRKKNVRRALIHITSIYLSVI